MNCFTCFKSAHRHTYIFALLILIGAFVASATHAQTKNSAPTNIHISSLVQHSGVHRLGVNLGDQTNWDSGQMTKSLIFANPGFEAQKYRSILHCAYVSANSCTDDNQWSPMATGFWNGATYRFISGPAAGKTGKIVSSVKNTAGCTGCGQIFTFDTSVSPAVNDYLIVSIDFPGNAQSNWNKSTSGAATLATEFKDLSPGSPGKQALRMTALNTGDNATITGNFDYYEGKDFIKLNGHFAFTFRAKGVGGANALTLEVFRNPPTGRPISYLQTTVKLTNQWADYTVPFSASEDGSPLGGVVANIIAQGSAVLIDDVYLRQTDSDPNNTTAFRDDVVNALLALKPGVIRNMASGAGLGEDIIDQISPAGARYGEGWYTGGNIPPGISYGIPEFLALCEHVGADPWLTIPTATTPEEIKILMDYLQGNGSTTYSALRVAEGQSAPWTSVFSKIHIELGNETWNGSFRGESMDASGYPQWANQVFGAARQTAGFDPTKYDLVLDGFATFPPYTDWLLKTSNQHDSVDIAPYLLFSVNDVPVSTMFPALFAEAEMYNAPGGEVYENYQYAATSMVSGSGKSVPTRLNVYETNLSPTGGSITQAELDQLTPSIGAGIGAVDSMMQMMRTGVEYQNAFALPQYDFRRGDSKLVKLWGIVVDMGNNNRRRPTYIAQALANTAIAGDMLETVQTGANPTWNQAAGIDVAVLSNAHYIQSFSYLNGQEHSAVLFNLSSTTTLPVKFTGPNAPTGSVAVNQLTSANITDTNETADVVEPKASSISTFGSSTTVSLPPYSMTVLTWTAPGSESGTSQTATPAFSVQPGTYTAAQNVNITDSTPGAVIHYTLDGSTPTASSAVFSAAINVWQTQTIKALATATNYTNSAVSGGTFTIGSGTATLAAPQFSVGGGTYTSAQTVAISAAAGATIHYTTNGSAPTASSSVYTAPLTVSSNETIEAFATKSGSSNSPVAVASYTISSVLPAPKFSPAGGTYTSAQVVTISDASASAVIYYTTDGSTPTSSSKKYTTPISVTTSQTLKAIAVPTTTAVKAAATAPVVSTASYSIVAAGGLINYSSSFTGSGLSLLGHAGVTSGVLQLTDGGTWEASSAWFKTPVPVQSFATDFDFQLKNANADGFTFTVQNAGLSALGPNGGSLGYSGIGKSVAIKFDLFDNGGEGSDSTGLYLNGAMPSVPSIDLSATPINLHSGHVIHAHIKYDGTTLSVTLTDKTTNGSITKQGALNIPGVVGSNNAYVGFTAGTGTTTATQDILNWTYTH